MPASMPTTGNSKALSPQAYLALFLNDGPEAVDRLIQAIQTRKGQVVQEWHMLYSSRFGAHHAISEKFFQEVYGPNLRAAAMCIVQGDAAGFVSLATELGEQLARAGLPFAAMVSHLSLWKESCAKALADDSAELCFAVILMDKLSSGFVSAAADGYFRHTEASPPGQTAAPAEVKLERAAPASTHSSFYGLVGRSAPMRWVFEQVRRVAPGSPAAPVLIVGETGTGKELAARAIHAYGPRHDGPFIAINCAALPRELIESELFGYVRGAFSGAGAENLGLFRAATGGTLLLDEITEMGGELQAKLLRVLQERTVRPVGSVTEVPVDVRIIASTNRDPQSLLASGLLRPDLYYRLCGSTIVLPPLRDRLEDVSLLVEYWLGVLNERYGRAAQARRGMTPAAMAALRSRPWPGNVRELFNVIENAFTASDTQHIGLTDIAEPTASIPRSTPPECVKRPQTFRDSERDLIERTLVSTRGNKLRAAQQLGISRKKLYARLAKYAPLAGLKQ